MDDDLKKTILQPRFANRMSYHTVVMDRPPVMMSEQRPAPANTVVKPGQDPRMTSIGALRTRMANAQAMPEFHNEKPLPPLPTHVPPRLAPLPPPQYSGTWNAPVVESKTKRRDVVRKGVILGGAAIVLGVCLVLPFSGSEKNSQAASIPAAPAATAPAATPATAPTVPMPDAGPEGREPVRPEATAAASTSAASAAPTSQTPVTAERAGSLLLGGRRREALVVYRQLANSPASTPGIQAMVEVLAQKVDAQ